MDVVVFASAQCVLGAALVFVGYNTGSSCSKLSKAVPISIDSIGKLQPGTLVDIEGVCEGKSVLIVNVGYPPLPDSIIAIENVVNREVRTTYTSADGIEQKPREVQRIDSKRKAVPFWLQDETGRITVIPDEFYLRVKTERVILSTEEVKQDIYLWSLLKRRNTFTENAPDVEILHFIVERKTLMPNQKVHVIGTIEENEKKDNNNEDRQIVSTDDFSLIISDKSAKELHKKDKRRSRTLISLGCCILLSAVVTGIFMTRLEFNKSR